MPVLATKALVRAAASGERLPLPLWMSPVEQRGGVFRRGHLVLIAGVPNSGKSALAQGLAAGANRPSLYFSADQDAWQSTTKLLAAITGEEANAIAHQLAAGNSEQYDEILSDSNIAFCFDSKPSLDDINLELDAYVETWDAHPEVVVVDTLRNVDGNGEKQDDEYIISELHGLARRTKACVILLVHASRVNVKDSTRPPGVRELVNKIDSLPDLVLLVAYDAEGQHLNIVIGKTREGKADPDAERPVSIRADFGTMQFGTSVASSWGTWEER